MFHQQSNHIQSENGKPKTQKIRGIQGFTLISMQGHQNQNPFNLKVLYYSVVIWSYMILDSREIKEKLNQYYYTGEVLCY